MMQGMTLSTSSSGLDYFEPTAFGSRPAWRTDPVETLWTVIATQSRDFLVLPDGRADLIVRFRVEDDGMCTGAVPILVGPSSLPHSIRITPWDGFIGVRLRPGRLSVLGQAGDLTDRRFQGEEAADRVSALATLPTHTPSVETMMESFLRMVERIDPPEPTQDVEAALERLHLAGGRLQINDLAVLLGIGVRRLHRLFHRHVGLSPQTYAGVLRFQRAVRLRHRGVEPAAVADEAGYSDQAHMTRAFRRYGGFTPARMPEVALGSMPVR